MWFKKFRDKEFKMIWRVEKGAKKSFIAGTAHFFPYSFQISLARCLKDVRTVMFEGPLDDDSMTRVVRAGTDRDDSRHLFDQLDEQTIHKITQGLSPACRRPNSSFEEQIKVLENLSHERILGFLQQIDRWPEPIRDYARNYLAGNLEKPGFPRLSFPSRHPSVINPRDKIFFDRMHDDLREGGIAAFVGAPHIRGLSRLIRKDGYQIMGPAIPD